MTLIKFFITAVAALLLLFVGLGLVLDGEWEVERSRVVPIPAEALYAELASIDGWTTWGSLGTVEGERHGPPSGPGATVRWDDPQWGEGEWTLTGIESDRAVEYEVRVEGGALVTRGRLDLDPVAEGTRIHWTESGDFGWNPFLAFMALGMDRMQGSEMEKSLDRLQDHLGVPPAPRPEGGSD
ncbi:SRPBCC family protein [Gemmatimonadota bacterium Y43]|uniref:SRPBCC family protein n=1 Tax=Gaopeijia maritima TaxID=3119007 RepID=UPI00326F86A8